MKSLSALASFAAIVALFISSAAHAQSRAQYESMVATHARANNVPEVLVHRVIVRESKYQPQLVGRGGTIGLMQIKLATARGLGYTGDAAGLRDPDTNLTYGVKYLAGAYRAANGDHGRAVHYYASGYYYAAKRHRSGQPLQITPVLASAPPQEAVQPGEVVNETAKDAAAEAVAAPGEAAANPAAPVVAAKSRKSRKALADAKALVPHPSAAVDPGAKAAQPR
jgi:Transglycosylase SLT domain